MQSEKFEKLYRANIEDVSKRVVNSLVMCGSSNWDFYFEKKPKNANFEEISNVILLELDDKAELDIFLSVNAYIDYSLEHEKPCVLIRG